MNMRRRIITEGPERTEGMLNTAAVNPRSGAGIEEAGAACTSEVGSAVPSSWLAGSRVGKPVEGRLMEGPERSPGDAEVG